MLFISPQKLYVLKICKLLPWLFAHISKRLDYDVTVWLTNNCNTHITQYLQSIFYIRISIKKQAFDFLKINSYTNYCLKFLCDLKLITSLLIFWFLVKFSRLLSWVFSNSWIWTRNSWIWTCNSWFLTRSSWIWARNSWI